jgi:hypothetical protein
VSSSASKCRQGVSCTSQVSPFSTGVAFSSQLSRGACSPVSGFMRVYHRIWQLWIFCDLSASVCTNWSSFMRSSTSRNAHMVSPWVTASTFCSLCSRCSVASTLRTRSSATCAIDSPPGGRQYRGSCFFFAALSLYSGLDSNSAMLHVPMSPQSRSLSARFSSQPLRVGLGFLLFGGFLGRVRRSSGLGLGGSVHVSRRRLALLGLFLRGLVPIGGRGLL